MLGSQDRFHAFVVLQRFRQRCRSRGTDVVVTETAQIVMNTQKESSRDTVRAKREDATQVCVAVAVARAGLTKSLSSCWLAAHGRHRPSCML